MNGGKRKFQNRLWQARKRHGLEQKQIAYLLDVKSVDKISRYENGSRLPNLKTALKLEIIYGVSLRALFPELYSHFQSHLKVRFGSTRELRDNLPDMLADDHCPFEELLIAPIVAKEVRNEIYRHAGGLIKAVNELPDLPEGTAL